MYVQIYHGQKAKLGLPPDQTIQKSVSWLSKNSRTNLFQAARNPSGDVARQFIRAGFNLTDLELKIRPVMVSDESSPTGELEASLRLTVLVFQQLFKTFGILDDALDERFSNYALAPGPQPSVLRDVWIIGNSTDIDEALSRSEASDLIDRGPTREASPLQWAAGIAGGYLVLLAVLMVVNGMPKGTEFCFCVCDELNLTTPQSDGCGGKSGVGSSSASLLSLPP